MLPEADPDFLLLLIKLGYPWNPLILKVKRLIRPDTQFLEIEIWDLYEVTPIFSMM